VTAGRYLIGPAGGATEVLVTSDEPDHQAHIGTWLLKCPGQSPAWDHYALMCVHLRPLPGESKPAHRRFPSATHEYLLLAINPETNPQPSADDEPGAWDFLRPVNVCEQVELPNDTAAAEVLHLCAQAVVNGILPAEPPLAGAVEPWRTVLLKTAAHDRGEVHAP
jgi:hypothetical protein